MTVSIHTHCPNLNAMLIVVSYITQIQLPAQDALEKKHLMMLPGKLDQSQLVIIIPDILKNLDFKHEPIKKKKDARYALEKWLDTQLNRKKARERFKNALLEIFFMTQDTPHKSVYLAEDEQIDMDTVTIDHSAKEKQEGKDTVDGCINIRKIVNCMHESDLKKFARKSLKI